MAGTCALPDSDQDPSTGVLVFEDLSAALLSITGTAHGDVYAVGADPDDGRGPYVLHYDGAAWERLETGATGDLWWISVTPVDGAYYLAGAGGNLMQYDPATGIFESFVTPSDDIVFGVWGTDAENVWAVGGDLDNEDAGGFVWRYDGSAWYAEDLSAVAAEGLPTLYKVWGRSANDVYAVGRLGLVLHFDGTRWSQAVTDTTRTLFTVHGNDASVVAVGGFGEAVIEELSGTSFVNRAPPMAPQLNGVFVPVAGEAVAAGNDGTIVRLTESGWQTQPVDFDTPWDFHSTWVDSGGGVWAVGGNLSAALDNGLIAYVGPRTIGTNVRR
jgi:hypothetical protein